METTSTPAVDYSPEATEARNARERAVLAQIGDEFFDGADPCLSDESELGNAW